MYKKIIQIALFLSTPWLINSSYAIPETAQDYVKVADNFRQAEDAMKIVSQISLYKNEKLSKTKQYTIYVKPQRKSLVLMQSPSEKGQKVLMLDDKFWMLLPKSRRPIRITPMQKLLGEASTGDIATLQWNDDYKAEFLDIKNNDTDLLKLSSKRKGTTYKTIELTLEKNTHKPLSAKLFVASGKLAKIAHYQYGTLNGREQVVSMTLLDRINKSKKTVITYKSMEPYNLANKFYNPAYLVKKPKIK